MNKNCCIIFPNQLFRESIFINSDYKIFLIEDSAEAHGQSYKDQMCGSFGDISTFSFYANKHITTGEGGMIVTNSKKIAEKYQK